MKKEDRRNHNINTRIKALQGRKLSEEDYKIYCYNCGKEIKSWEFFIPTKIQHDCMGWCHRWEK